MMKKVDVTAVLNDRFDCTQCHASHSWIPTARVAVRQYSSIHRLRCGHCGQQIVAKMVGGKYSIEYARVHARKEYDALCTLQSAFPQDERYGTLVPLGHFEYARQGIIVTRLVPGDDLMHYVRTLDASGMQATCGSAGVWLKKLHDSDVKKRQNCMGTADKVSHLVDTYGAVLRADPKTCAACELLIQEGSDIDALAVLAVRQHGDFKPGNVLCDGRRYVGLDIGWRTTGAAVYDVAPFLNHLWLDIRVLTGSRTRHLYDLAELAFLSGYGDVSEMRALRWAQLYFALCYMGGYRQRGRLTASYASWKVWPLVRRLVTQLEAAG